MQKKAANKIVADVGIAAKLDFNTLYGPRLYAAMNIT